MPRVNGAEQIDLFALRLARRKERAFQRMAALLGSLRSFRLLRPCALCVLYEAAEGRSERNRVVMVFDKLTPIRMMLEGAVVYTWVGAIELMPASTTTTSSLGTRVFFIPN